MSAITSSANGTYIDCGFGMGVALTITCGGPSCQALQSYPNLQCTTDPSTTTSTCTNGITCAGSTNFKSAFTLAQHTDNTVTSTQNLTIDSETFTGTDDGKGDVSYSSSGGDGVPPTGSQSSSSAAPPPTSPNSPVTPIQNPTSGVQTTNVEATTTGGANEPTQSGSEVIILPTTILGPSTATATAVVVLSSGTGTASSSPGGVPAATSHSSFRLRPSRMIFVLAMILSLFVAHIQAQAPLIAGSSGAGPNAKTLIVLLPLLWSVLPVASAQSPGGSCSVNNGGYCEGTSLIFQSDSDI
jgi:hypothetical protein